MTTWTEFLVPSIRAWIEAHCDVGDGLLVRSSELYKHFVGTNHQGNGTQVSASAFGRVLRLAGFNSLHRPDARYWTGLKPRQSG